MPHRPLTPRRRRHRALLIVVVTAVLAGALEAEPAGAAPPPPTYVPPVDAPVHDPFRAPAGPYAAGNRGIEYDTAPGTAVAAVADGRVTFAGWVAGARHVTVLHDDGVRTTASYLAEVVVVVGQQVRQGEVLGTTVGRLHLGARRGDAYFDPATLFAGGPVRVRLVPFDLPLHSGPLGELSAITQLVGLGGAAADALLEHAGATAGALWHYAPHLLWPPAQAALVALSAVGALRQAWEVAHRPCTADGDPVPPPAGRRIGLLVAGFGSTSDGASIEDLDVDALGYRPADVLRFSYAGGRVPDADVRLAGVPVTAYDAVDATQDLWRSGARLADLVEAVAAASPGVPIDLLAHSQGGVVARLALLELEARHGRGWLDRVGLLATIGTPHEGADLATAGAALGTSVAGTSALQALGDLGVHATEPAMAQLAETSAVVAELGRAGLPEGLRAVSVAARGDLIVPAPRTDLDGAVEAIVPIGGLQAHSDLPGDPHTTREVALARAGLPPRCVGLVTALADATAGRVIGAVEDGLGSLLWVAGTAGEPIARPVTAGAALAADAARR